MFSEPHGAPEPDPEALSRDWRRSGPKTQQHVVDDPVYDRATAALVAALVAGLQDRFLRFKLPLPVGLPELRQVFARILDDEPAVQALSSLRGEAPAPKPAPTVGGGLPKTPRDRLTARLWLARYAFVSMTETANWSDDDLDEATEIVGGMMDDEEDERAVTIVNNMSPEAAMTVGDMAKRDWQEYVARSSADLVATPNENDPRGDAPAVRDRDSQIRSLRSEIETLNAYIVKLGDERDRLKAEVGELDGIDPTHPRLFWPKVDPEDQAVPAPADVRTLRISATIDSGPEAPQLVRYGFDASPIGEHDGGRFYTLAPTSREFLPKDDTQQVGPELKVPPRHTIVAPETRWEPVDGILRARVATEHQAMMVLSIGAVAGKPPEHFAPRVVAQDGPPSIVDLIALAPGQVFDLTVWVYVESWWTDARYDVFARIQPAGG